MRKRHSYYIYIITNPNRTTLYIGVTNNLARRLVEHYANKGTTNSFAGKYYCYRLIYCEHFKYINTAIAREKELKKWNRKRKEELIASKNPDWKFYNEFYCKEWPPREKWGAYMEKFKLRKSKKTKKIPNNLISNNPICIYEDEEEVAMKSTEIAMKIEEELTIGSTLQQLETKINNQSKFTERERYLISLSILMATNQKEAFATQLQELPKQLFSEEEMEELFLQIGLYTGLATAKSARGVWESVRL